MNHPLHSLSIGDHYTWDGLQKKEHFDTGFGTGGGILTKTDNSGQEYVILFSSDDGLYDDNVFDGKFTYIGQGRPDKGDQDPEWYTNKALIESMDDERTIYFFHRTKKGNPWTFHGLVRVLDYEFRYRESEERKVIVFSLEFRASDVKRYFESGESEDSSIQDSSDLSESTSSEDPLSEDEIRDHVKIQHSLIKIGIAQGYDVYVAKNDQHESYDGDSFKGLCQASLSLPGFNKQSTDIIEYVDVVWLDGNHIVKMFEVESTTSIFSGILRMTDFATEASNIAVDMYIVAPTDDEGKVKKQFQRPTFQSVLSRAEYCSLDYISFDTIEDKHSLISQHGPLVDIF